METNNELIPEQEPNKETDFEQALDTEPVKEPEAGSSIETVPEGRANLEICPNCLEPNDDDLAVCCYCGMPLHPGPETDPSAMPEDEQTLAKNRAEAVPEKKEEKKPQESGFRRVMPWLGLYLIYYAVTSCFDIKRQIKQAVEEGQQVNEALAYLSQAIWLVDGLLMAWPLIKKGWNKIHPSPEKPEEPESVSEAAAEDENDTETGIMNEEEADPETRDESDRDFSAEEPDAVSDFETDADEQQPGDNNE